MDKQRGAPEGRQRLLPLRSSLRFLLISMLADPGQQTDVAARHPDVAQQLRTAYDAWYQDVTRDGFGRPPIPVGYAQAPVVELPAPEAYLHGKLRWKGKAGYANDWITNWTSMDDRIHWDLDVVRAGRYEVALLYTCPPADVGSRIRVAVGSQQVEATLSQAHDPSPLPSPDRVDRGEVYEKVWAPLAVGALPLERGPAKLTITALTKPGKAVMDLKAVRIRRVVE